MSSLGNDIVGASVLDLFAGSGALGLEALSRGAKSAAFVESNPLSMDTLKQNVDLLGVESEVTVVKSDAMDYIKHLGKLDFDIALADPPYGKGYAQELIETFRDHPFASRLWIEHAKGEIDESFSDYGQRQYGETVISIVEAG
jgi:16S rRNA (guanine966-N2)-methyltransferase